MQNLNLNGGKQLMRARHLFSQQLEFLGSSFLLPETHKLELPNQILASGSSRCPEIAFAGQSNVGKSSLIKALFIDPSLPVKKMQQLMKSDCLPSSALSYMSNTSRLVVPSPVKTSKRPGHTRACNFFSVGHEEDQFRLVDMPGYGLNSRHEWGQMSMQYFDQRRELKRVFLLRDITKPFDHLDVSVMRILDQCRVPFQLVLTKSDVYPVELQRFREKVVQDARLFCSNESSCFVDTNVLCVAALTGSGIDQLKMEISDIVSASHRGAKSSS